MMVGSSDSFVIVNGPQDGTEFRVERSPVQIGQDPVCAVNIRLDNNVCALHAVASAVSDGYRVRKLDRAPVLVNGKKVGTIRSRTVRHGGNIQVGNTLLAVECSADGLASRSHGMPTETDFAWVMRSAAGGLFRGLRGITRGVLRTLGRLATSWPAILGILFLCYAFWPWFRDWVNYFVLTFYYRFIHNILQNSILNR